MIWLYIYLGISVAAFLMVLFANVDATEKFKRRHPNAKIPKCSFIVNLGSWFRSILICLIPVFNILWLGLFLFCYSEIVDKAVDNEYLKYLTEKEKEDGSEC